MYQKPKVHEGNNIKKVRQMMGMKQYTLGQKCLSKYDQRRISEFESMWTIPALQLEEIAAALGVIPHFIQHFEEYTIMDMMKHSHTRSDSSNDPQHDTDQIVPPQSSIQRLVSNVLQAVQELKDALSTYPQANEVSVQKPEQS